MSSETIAPPTGAESTAAAAFSHAVAEVPAVIRVEDVSKCYHLYDKPADRLKQALLLWRKQYYREFWALRGVSFEVRRGEAVGIVGRNGSGKSTLLQIIAGTLTPTTGRVQVAGRVAALLELGSGFNPEFTGRENVYLNGSVLGLSRREIDDRFDAIAGFADIGPFLDQPVKTYSSGMLVRLAFAVQVQLSPDVLIVDEALAVGDALFQKRCYQRLDELRTAGTTLLFVSHSQETVRSLCDRAVLLDGGRVRAAGPSGDVILEYRRLLHNEEKRWLSNELGTMQAKAQTAAAAKPSVDRTLEFGDLDAEIEDVQVTGPDGPGQAVFAPGDAMAVRVSFVVHKPSTNLCVSLRLRNKQGVKMYSWGTLNQDIAGWAKGEHAESFWERSFVAGERVTVEFTCDTPLGADLYEIQAALTHEEDRHFNRQRILHWRDEAAFFQVVINKQQYFFGGVADLRMRARVVD